MTSDIKRQKPCEGECGGQNDTEISAITKEIGTLKKNASRNNIMLGKLSKKIEMLENDQDGFYEELFDLLRNRVGPKKYHVKIKDEPYTSSSDSSDSSDEYSAGFVKHLKRPHKRCNCG